MSALPYMQFYPADYLAATGHLSPAQHGAYFLLLLNYWTKGSLPKDEKLLARIARMSEREWKANRDIVAEFFNDDWTHERVEKDLVKARTKSAARAEAGKAGFEAKRLKTNDAPQAIASGLPEQNDPVAQASSSDIRYQNKEETNIVGFPPTKTPAKTNGEPVYHKDFQYLWKHIFPRHPNASKIGAYKAWLRLSDDDRDKCFDGALAYATFLAGERQKRPDAPGLHLSTFINERRFDSLLEAAQ